MDEQALLDVAEQVHVEMRGPDGDLLEARDVRPPSGATPNMVMEDARVWQEHGAVADLKQVEDDGGNFAAVGIKPTDNVDVVDEFDKYFRNIYPSVGWDGDYQLFMP